MGNAIYYFSGTGNSLATARKLADRLNNCEVRPITELVKDGTTALDGDVIGFVFPLYFQSMPKTVLEFFLKVENINAGYIFAVVTRAGGFMQGGALSHLKHILMQKKMVLSAGFYVKMPSNCVPWEEVHSADKQKSILESADRKISYISRMIKSQNRKVEPEPLFFIRPRRYKMYFRTMKKAAEKFHVTDNCKGCGTCIDICQAGNLQMNEGKPVWENKCQLCLACINYCPNQAIEYGSSSGERKRYHHPEISAKEFTE